MKDVQTLLEAYRAEAEVNAPFALATVVQVDGSAYRLPGARMLIDLEGRRFGSLSGGCLEADVAAHAMQAMSSGEPFVVRYDARHANGDMILETGCKGAIAILIEPFSTPDLSSSLGFLTDLFTDRQSGVMATVFASEGEDTVRIGDRLMIAENAVPSGGLKDTPLADAILREAATMRPAEKTRAMACRSAQGVVHILLESLIPPIALLLCGSGHDTAPLVRIGAAMGWQVTVADPDSSALTVDRYPDAHSLLPIRPECLTTRMAVDRRTAAVLMTHRYAADLAWFRELLRSPVGYLGVLGPRLRWQEMQRDLAASGDVFPESELARVHSPAGLDIGSETPEEIALAIVAEIQAVMNSRAGGFLRQRDARIHPTDGDAPLLPLFVSQGTVCPLSAS